MERKQKLDPRANYKKIIAGHPERVLYRATSEPDPRPDSREERQAIWDRHFGPLQKQWRENG
jgi:hypothetical protein